MSDIPNVPIALPSLGNEEWEAIKEPLLSGWLTQGPKVAQFEEAFAKKHGVKNALAVTSCTTALHLALRVLGVGPGDEVIVPSFTWVATANVVLYCGAKPVLVDVDPATFNLDPDRVSEAITKKTRAIIAVHLFGLCADIKRLRAVAQGLPIVEDAACAVGAAYFGESAGTLGELGAFSFHPRKIVTTGEGGMVTTNNDNFAETVSSLRSHGATVSEEQRHWGNQPYLLPEFPHIGFNYRMTDLQAAVGIVQLAKLDSFLSERRKWAAVYQEELSSLEWLQVPKPADGYEHSWQSFVCLVREDLAPMGRDRIMAALHEMKISTRPGTHAVHTLKFYRDTFGYQPADFPQADKCARWSMAIPLHNKMVAVDYERVIDAIRSLGC